VPPFHPLDSDHDVPATEVALAEAECALALGRLDGLLTGLNSAETVLFSWALLRLTLLSGLAGAGFADAEMRFNGWFAGLERGPAETRRTPFPAHVLVRAVLAELADHPWAPLAEVARIARRIGRFAPDGAAADPGGAAATPGDAVERARALVCPDGAPARSSSPSLPFPALASLTGLARHDPLFAPVEQGVAVLPVGRCRSLAVRQAAPAAPLWALDLALGNLLADGGTWSLPIPCPGALRPAALAPHLWPGERALVLAQGLDDVARRLGALVATARRRGALMERRLAHLRSSARAPQVWMAAVAFAPLGLDQIVTGFGVSRRGTYAVSDALVGAGLVTRRTERGMVVLAGRDTVEAPTERPSTRGIAPPSPALPAPALAEFDAAMADLDRLLTRYPGAGAD